MYEVGTATTVRAFHVMEGLPLPEGERHSHDYRIEVVATRGALDQRGMVCDLDVLDAALDDIADRIRDRDLEPIVRPERGEVTVEAFARWVHSELSAAVASEGAEALSVRVYESEVAFGGYRAAVR